MHTTAFLKMLLIYILGLAIITVTSYHQNDYKIKHHRLELIYYNRKYVRNLKMCMAPLNRTARAINASFDIVFDAKYPPVFTFQAYKFASNEYREFPMRMAIDVCKEFQENRFGLGELINHSNIRSCMIQKGSYYIKMYRPDETHFPPYLVGGDYKLAINVSQDSDLVIEAHWYGSVQTVEKWLRVI